MFYSNMLQGLQKSEKNPVNRMYLNEIKIKWNKIEELCKDTQNLTPEQLIEELTAFTAGLQNQKYIYNKQTKTGFPYNSELFSALYLDDLLSLVMSKIELPEIKGLLWGYQHFTQNVSFFDMRILSDQEKKDVEFDISPKVLQLAQHLEIQFRNTGTRNFAKKKLHLPILIFRTYKCFSNDDFLRANKIATEAKKTFSASKTIVLTETIQHGFPYSVHDSKIDSIFVLRKKFSGGSSKDLCPSVIFKLEDKIREYLFTTKPLLEEELVEGVIE